MFVQDIYFWLIFMATPVAVYYLTYKSGISLFCISIPSILILSYFAFAYCGIPLLYYNLSIHSQAYGVTDRDVVFRVLLYASVGWVGLALGFVVFSKLFGRKAQESTPVVDNIGKAQILYVVLFLLIAVGVYLFYLSQASGVALFAAFHGDSVNQDYLRNQMTHAFFSGKFAWQPLLYEDILSFLCFFMFSLALLRRTMWTWLLWLVLFLAAASPSIMSAQKGPLVFLVSGLWLSFVLTRDNGRLTLKNMGGFLAALVGSLIFLLALLMHGNADTLLNVTALASRILTGSLTPAYFYLRVFPDVHGYLHGASISNLHGLLPFEQFDLVRMISDVIFPGNAAKGLVGSAPTAFWGEAYANFGPMGPLFVAVPIGFCVYLLQVLVGRLPGSPITVGILTWLVIHVQLLSVTSFSNYLTDQHLFTVMLAAAIGYRLGDRNFFKQYAQALAAVFKTPATSAKPRD